MEDGISQRRHGIATNAIKAFSALYEIEFASLLTLWTLKLFAIAIVKDKLQAFVISAELCS